MNKSLEASLHAPDRLTYEAVHPLFVPVAPGVSLLLRVERESGIDVERSERFDGEICRIGAHPTNDIVLDDPAVSGFHLALVFESGSWRVRDFDSRNGVRLHGVRVLHAELPYPEAVLELGATRLRIRQEPREAEEQFTPVAAPYELVGESPEMRKLMVRVRKVAEGGLHALVRGERGTPRDVIASELVRLGDRSKHPLVMLECRGVYGHALTQDLFGVASSPGVPGRPGAVAMAQGGTLFLDEVTALSDEAQLRLTELIRKGTYFRSGDTESREADVRVIVGTEMSPEQLVNSARMSEEVLACFSKSQLSIPPLRERASDIPVLVRKKIDELAMQERAHLMTPEVIEEFCRAPWSGNDAELLRVVEHRLREGHGDTLPSSSSMRVTEAPPANVELPFRAAKEAIVAAFERQYVATLLGWAEGNVSRAARKASMDRMNLYRLMQRYGFKGSNES